MAQDDVETISFEEKPLTKGERLDEATSEVDDVQYQRAKPSFKDKAAVAADKARAKAGELINAERAWAKQKVQGAISGGGSRPSLDKHNGTPLYSQRVLGGSLQRSGLGESPYGVQKFGWGTERSKPLQFNFGMRGMKGGLSAKPMKLSLGVSMKGKGKGLSFGSGFKFGRMKMKFSKLKL